MQRRAIDRWADTKLFRAALTLAALPVAPVLLVGIALVCVSSIKVFAYGWPVDLEPGAIAVLLLTTGGVCGFVGFARAHRGCSAPREHNVTATLVLLAAGVLAAIGVAGIVLGAVLQAGIPWRSASHVYVAAALFAAANLVWAFAGIAWMQRLMRRYGEATGRAFDGLPVVLLCVAIALSVAATLRTLAL